MMMLASPPAIERIQIELDKDDITKKGMLVWRDQLASSEGPFKKTHPKRLCPFSSRQRKSK